MGKSESTSLDKIKNVNLEPGQTRGRSDQVLKAHIKSDGLASDLI